MRNDAHWAAECCFSRLNSAACGTLYLISLTCVSAHGNSEYCRGDQPCWCFYLLKFPLLRVHMNILFFHIFPLTHKQATLSHDNSIEGKLNITQVEHKRLATHLHWCKALLNPIATVTSVTNYHSEGSSRDRRATEERRGVESNV